MDSKIPFELANLSEAKNYQKWIIETISPYLGNGILELGSGIGNMSRFLPIREKLILTENDPTLLRLLKNSFKGNFLEKDKLRIEKFDIENDSFDCFNQENIDTIVHFNVLEHLKNDGKVLLKINEFFKKNEINGPKRHIMFVPAHQWAFGTIDVEVGHYRRYGLKSLKNLVSKFSPGTLVDAEYFNFFGLWGWCLNGKILKRKEVKDGMIRLFERFCPLLKRMDRVIHSMLRIPLGQSLFVVLTLE